MTFPNDDLFTLNSTEEEASKSTNFFENSAPRPNPESRGSTNSRELLLEQQLDKTGLSKAQEASRAISYHWNIASDIVLWSSNASALLGCTPESLATGKTFAGLLDNQNLTSRYDCVNHSATRDKGDGVAFEIEYLMRPEGRQSEASTWIEDHGRWFADATGNPADVYGVMRKVDERHVRDQEMNYLSNCDTLTGMMNRNRMMDV